MLGSLCVMGVSEGGFGGLTFARTCLNAVFFLYFSWSRLLFSGFFSPRKLLFILANVIKFQTGGVYVAK